MSTMSTDDGSPLVFSRDAERRYHDIAKRVLGEGGTRLLTWAVGPFELLVSSLLAVAEDIGLPAAAHPHT